LLSLKTVPIGVVTAFGLPTAFGLTTGAAGVVGIITGMGLAVGAGVGIITGMGLAAIGAGVITTVVPALAVLIKAKRANVDVTVLIITFISCVC
jgi:hypothetical protein